MDQTISDSKRLSQLRRLKDRVRFVYEAHTAFRNAIIIFDLSTVIFFLITTFMPMADWIRWFDYAIGTLLTADLACRYWITRDRRRFVTSLWTLTRLIHDGRRRLDTKWAFPSGHGQSRRPFGRRACWGLSGQWGWGEGFLGGR